MVPRSASPIRLAAWIVAAIAGLGVVAGAGEAEAAGINIERVRLNPDEDGVHGGFQIGVDFQAGNTNLLNFSTSASVAFRKGAHLGFLIGSSKFATRTRAIAGEDISTLLDPGSRYINRADVHLRYNYEILDWLAAEAFTQVERDEFLLLEGRVLFGLGPRFVPFNDGEFSLALGTDWMLEFEALDPTRVVRPLPAQTLVHRWSSYLALIYAANDRLRMSSTTYVQPRFDRFGDLRILSEGNVDLTLIEPVSVRLALRLRWDTQPSAFCAAALEVGGCAPADEVRLREVDVTIENSIAVRF